MAIEITKLELPSNEVVDHFRLGRPSHSNSSTSDHVENPLQSKVRVQAMEGHVQLTLLSWDNELRCLLSCLGTID
jgi:hypothetical protein